MGLLDFLRRKPKPDEPPGAGLEAVLNDARNQPRRQHYLFAHVVLRQLAFENPMAVVGSLHSPKAGELLAMVWKDVTERVREAGEPTPLDGSELRAEGMLLGGFPCVIVTMPPPVATTEAHFVALVLHLRPGAGKNAPEKPELSYFTLEKGFSTDGSDRTVLCAWSADQAHSNYGDGPEPTVPAFARAVEAMLAKAGK